MGALTKCLVPAFSERSWKNQHAHVSEDNHGLLAQDKSSPLLLIDPGTHIQEIAIEEKISRERQSILSSIRGDELLN